MLPSLTIININHILTVYYQPIVGGSATSCAELRRTLQGLLYAKLDGALVWKSSQLCTAPPRVVVLASPGMVVILQPEAKTSVFAICSALGSKNHGIYIAKTLVFHSFQHVARSSFSLHQLQKTL